MARIYIMSVESCPDVLVSRHKVGDEKMNKVNKTRTC